MEFVKGLYRLDRRVVSFDCGLRRRHCELFGTGYSKMTKALDLMRRYEWLPWFLIVTVAVAELFAFARKPTAPVLVYSVTPVNQRIQAGEMAQFTVSMNRTRPCPASTHGFWVDELGQMIEALPVRTTGYTRTGDSTVPLAVRAPSAVGRMCYRSLSYSTCETGMFITDTPQACIEVVP